MLNRNALGRRGSGIAAAGAVLALAVTACGGGDTAAVDAEGNEMTDIEITVSQWPSLAFAVPYHVGIKNGCFEEQGINVTGVVATDGGGTTIRSLLAGDLSFGEAATSATVSSYLAGAPVVAVGAGVQTVSDIMFVAPHESEMNSIEDVPGHKIAYSNPGSVTQSVLGLSLEADAIDPASAELIAAGGVSAGITAMEAGGVDAAVWSDPTYSQDPEKYKVLWNAADLIGDFQQTAIITSPELVKNNPELVTGFLAGRACGIEKIKEDPEAAAEIWASEGDLEIEAATLALDNFITNDHWGIGFSADGIKAAEEGMRIAGVVEDDVEVPWSEIINQDLLPEGAESVELPR